MPKDHLALLVLSLSKGTRHNVCPLELLLYSPDSVCFFPYSTKCLLRMLMVWDRKSRITPTGPSVSNTTQTKADDMKSRCATRGALWKVRKKDIRKKVFCILPDN